MDHVLYDLLKFVDHVLYALCCLICGSCALCSVLLNLWIMSVSGTRQFCTLSVSSVSSDNTDHRRKKRSSRAQNETKLWLGRLIALSVEGPRAGSVFNLDYYHGLPYRTKKVHDGKSIYCWTCTCQIYLYISWQFPSVYSLRHNTFIF